ncbi:GtrA family protein [Roseicella aquatilis]|uniref:GtrA family protein n=1 Tax=Roseicella aquatilis TaxID=2527868 RepID=A0A4R4D3Q6_9PROT|nr:GtrA family protein [Roseicella aquatilis]TCZ52264.1 GtrA family protein [Roseicella aquatilis]
MLVLRYALFAVLSMAANLAVQAGVFHLLPAGGLLPAMAAGTVAGFALKYGLDKVWIFADPVESHVRELRKVVLYGLFSVVTTCIFWGFETIAWFVWRTEAAKYAGAVLGLCIGYGVKYLLDRRFTFRARP